MFDENGEFIEIEDVKIFFLTCTNCCETTEGQEGVACPECGAEMEKNPSVLC